MSEWKGPWKCLKHGVIENHERWSANGQEFHNLGPYGPCWEKLEPHDRRAPDPRVASLVAAKVSGAPEYTPACFDCRRLAGKSPAGVKADDLCEWHANAWVQAYRAAIAALEDKP